MRDPPRVLILHNRYREHGGEERAVADLAALLARRGHAVAVLERDSRALAGAIGRARAGAALLAGGERPAEVAAAARRLGADVVHVHNALPLFGPRALRAARSAGAATVLHLHNFRLYCAIGVAYRDGEPCHRCRGRDTLPGLRLRCRGGAVEAATYAAGLALHQPALLAAADRLLVPSAAGLRALAGHGLPAGRADVLPHHLPAGAFVARSRAGEGEYALFAGRLVEEKGADVAIVAARAAGFPLAIAGAGPDEARLRALAAGADVRFLGRLGPEAMAAARAGAALALVPSRSEEMGGYVVLEALAAGLPVLVSDLGGLPELVEPESVLAPRDVDAWAAALRALAADPGRRAALGERALARARERFGEDRFHAQLMVVYARAGAAAAVARPLVS